LTFLKYLKNSEFLTFALIISSTESQSEAQVNQQSIGESKTGYSAGNKKNYTDENFNKSLHLFTLPFHTLLIITDVQSNASWLPISYNFHVMLLLVNVMFPSEFRQ